LPLSLTEIATKEIGYAEGKNNANKYSKALGRPAESWCADFVVWCMKQAGHEKKILNSASVIEITNWAKKNALQINPKLAREGDIISFDFTHTGKPQHIGIVAKQFDIKKNSVETIEGNTSAGQGSQSNGDCVAHKVRGLPYIYQVFRPKY
jgi:hypothetical protein